jgi:hypothetical protein
MKLHEIVEGNRDSSEEADDAIDEARKVIDDHYQWAINNRGGSFSDLIENLTYNANTKAVALRSSVEKFWLRDHKIDTTPFKWMLEKDCPLLSVFTLSRTIGSSTNRLPLESFEDLPNCRYINLAGNIGIKSFKGIEKLSNLRRISIRESHLEEGCGLLSLLKAAQLKEVEIDDETNEADQKAFHIFYRYFGTQNVADFMDELIEAGFKKYAKY